MSLMGRERPSGRGDPRSALRGRIRRFGEARIGRIESSADARVSILWGDAVGEGGCGGR